jgi:hypothetical protein
MTAMTNAEAATTTFGDPASSRTAYCKDVISVDDSTETLFDFMDIDYHRAVMSLPTKGAVEWRKNASLASLSYDYYRKTGYWQLILLYNGFISASHIPSGATVNIPDISTLKSTLQASKKGQVVRF